MVFWRFKTRMWRFVRRNLRKRDWRVTSALGWTWTTSTGRGTWCVLTQLLHRYMYTTYTQLNPRHTQIPQILTKIHKLVKIITIDYKLEYSQSFLKFDVIVIYLIFSWEYLRCFCIWILFSNTGKRETEDRAGLRGSDLGEAAKTEHAEEHRERGGQWRSYAGPSGDLQNPRPQSQDPHHPGEAAVGPLWERHEEDWEHPHPPQ